MNFTKSSIVVRLQSVNKRVSYYPYFFINYLESKNGIKNSDVLSPTFNIVYDYDIRNLKILHYDLYRLKNYKDISQLGMFETSNDSIKIVEWPELIESKPKDRIDIFFKYFSVLLSRTYFIY